MSSMHEVLRAYRADISLSKSPNTVAGYYSDMTNFFVYLERNKVKTVKAIKAKHFQDYLRLRKENGMHDTTLNRYYMSAANFCKWAKKGKLLQEPFIEEIERPRVGQYVPFIPTKEQVKELLAQPNLATEAGTRDKAILELLYSSGLRASELTDLEIGDLREASIIVRNGKGNKSRTVPLTFEAVRCITDYIEKYRGHEEGYLFVTCAQKKGINRQYLCQMIQKYGQKAGMHSVTTHTLRHACATHLLEQGADLRMIQLVLGHKDISSTQRYTHISSALLNNMFHTFHPRANHGQTRL